MKIKKYNMKIHKIWKAMNKMNKKMEAIIEAIPDLMFEVSLDGTFYNF